MKKFWFSLLLLCFAGNLFGQVKFNLSFQAETQTYTVSVMPETTFAEPKNMLGSAQIVLRAKYSENFTPIISSLVEGLVWADNAYIDFPSDAPEFVYVCVALVNAPTKKIPLTAGKQVDLFSFKNAGGTCPGLIELVANEDPQVQTVRAANFNVTQHFGVLGARGNAYAGIVNGMAECTVSGAADANNKMIDEVQIAPIPADMRVTVSWLNQMDLGQRMEMVITDSKSGEVYREKMSGSKGVNSVNVDVSSWKSGVYYVRFQFANGLQTRGWHFMVMR